MKSKDNHRISIFFRKSRTLRQGTLICLLDSLHNNTFEYFNPEYLFGTKIRHYPPFN